MHTRFESSEYHIIRPAPYFLRHSTQTWTEKRTSWAYYRRTSSRYSTPTYRRHRHYYSRPHTYDIKKVLKDPNILSELKAELQQAIPRKESQLEWAELEKLPYLRGVIKETLRTSSWVSGRLPRDVPPTGAVICGQRIIPGVGACLSSSPSSRIEDKQIATSQTIVSSSAHVNHHDPNVCRTPKPLVLSIRWSATSNSTHWEKNMMPFSKGSRMRPGMK